VTLRDRQRRRIEQFWIANPRQVEVYGEDPGVAQQPEASQWIAIPLQRRLASVEVTVEPGGPSDMLDVGDVVSRFCSAHPRTLSCRR
jgi:hypothetical protein